MHQVMDMDMDMVLVMIKTKNRTRMAGYNKFILLLLCLCWLPSVLAVDNRLEKSISAKTIYTDNAGLKETNKKGDLILSVTPQLSLHREAARSRVDLITALELNSQNEGGENFNPRLQFDSNWEFYEDHFFLDLDATAMQNSNDPFDSNAFDTVNTGNGVVTTYNMDISPYIVNHFRRYADLETRYTYNHQISSGGDAEDSSSNLFAISLNSGKAFSRYFWGLHYTKEDQSYDETDNGLDTENFDVNMGYAINRSWRVNGTVGYEDNSFVTNRSTTNGATWSSDVTWTPSARTSLTVGYGDRFFGNTPSLDFEHRFRRSVITVSYSKELTNSSRLLGDQEVFQVVDQFGNVIVNPATGTPFLVTSNQTALNDNSFIDERVEGSYTYQGRRMSLTWDVSYSTQTDEVGVNGGVDSTLFDTSLSFSRSLSRENELTSSIRYNQAEEGSGADSDRHQFNLGWSHLLAAETSLDIGYSYSKQNADDMTVFSTANSYTENRISIGFSHQFK